MAQVTIAARSSVCPQDVCDLFVFPAVDPGYEISGAVFAMKPESRGSVRLNSTDPAAPLAIEHGFLREHRDAEVLTEGVERLRALGTSPQRRTTQRASFDPARRWTRRRTCAKPRAASSIRSAHAVDPAGEPHGRRDRRADRGFVVAVASIPGASTGQFIRTRGHSPHVLSQRRKRRPRRRSMTSSGSTGQFRRTHGHSPHVLKSAPQASP